MEDLLTLSDGHLIGLSGIQVFKSGLEYFQSGAVLECAFGDGRVSGVVSDGRRYNVTLRHTAVHFEGRCDCSESTDTDFCKHSVALAMQYRRELAEHTTLASGDMLDRIRAFINTLSKAELAEALRAVIEDDTSLQNRWSVKADLALNKVDSRLIRKRITAAFPYNKRLYRRGQVREYFNNASAEIELFEKQLPQIDADKALQLLDYAFQRLQRAIATIDDSHGHRLNLLDTLRRHHITALKRCDWKVDRLVKYLEELEAGTSHDFYPKIPADYANVLGSDGLQAYLKSKQDQWDALPSLSFGADWEQAHDYLKIQAHLLTEASRQHDTDSEINLLEKLCIDSKACLFLCKRLLELGKWEKLEYWLAKAQTWEHHNSAASHLPNLDLKRIASGVLMHKGQTNDALDLQWDVYQQSNLIDDYKQLMRLAELAGSTEEWKARIFRRLHKTIDDPSPGHFVQRTLNHLIELYLLEHQAEAALDLVNYHSLSYQALELLIKAFPSHADTVYPLYQKQVNLLLNQSNNHAFKEAVDLIALCKRTVKPQDEHHFQALLDTTRRDHKSKTAFLKMLSDAV